MKAKLILVLIVLSVNLIVFAQYDNIKDQGILIKNKKLIYFNLNGYLYNEMRLNPKEWKKNLVDVGYMQYIDKGVLNLIYNDKTTIIIQDGKYSNNKMWGDEVFPYDEHQFTVYFRIISPTKTEVSKDNENWEPLIVEFRSYKNLWPADFIPYLHNDYKCTLYFKCSFFEGLYDAFTYPEEPG